MKISELTIGQGNVDVEGTIKEVGELRVFSKFGKELRVADSDLEDDSGTVKLTLWNDDFDKFKAGDKVKITNGYVREFQGEKQLTAGKFGKIEKIGEGEVSAEPEGQAELPGEETKEKPTEEAEDKEEQKEEPEEKETEEKAEDKEQEDF